MKKTKIVKISLGIAGISAIGLSTPIIATSCSNKGLVSDSIVKLPEAYWEEGYRLEREKGTNNFHFYSNKEEWTIEDLGKLELGEFHHVENGEGGLLEFVDKQTLKENGFSKELIDSPYLTVENENEWKEINIAIGVVGNNEIKYPGFTDFEILDLINAKNKTESCLLVNTFKIYEIDWNEFHRLDASGTEGQHLTLDQIMKKAVIKQVNFPLTFTIHPKSK